MAIFFRIIVNFTITTATVTVITIINATTVAVIVIN